MADSTLKLAFVLSATDKMSRIVDEAVKKSTDKLSAFERTTGKVGRSMMKAGTMMAGAGAAIGAGVLGAAKSTAAYGDEMWKASQKVGIGVEEMQKLAYAAKYSDVELSSLTSGMTKFNRKMVDAVGGSKTAGKVFSDLGIKLKDSSGKMRAPNEVLEEVAEIFKNVADGPEKTAAAMEIFGKSGADLIPLLNSGKQGLKEMGDEAARTGFVMSEETAKSCEQFNDNLSRVADGAKGAIFQLGGAMIPTLDNLAQKLTGAIGKVTDWIKENPKLAETIGKVALILAGLLITMGTASILFGGLTFVVGKFASVFRGVSDAIKAGKAIITACKNSMLLFRIQYAALVVWQKLAAAAQWLFNTSLFACPVVWIIAAIAAIIGAVVMLVKHWDAVAGFFTKLWSKIVGIFKQAWEWIKGMFLNYTPAGLIIKHWDKIGAFFVTLWDKVKTIFRDTWDWIKNMFLSYTPAGLIIKHWDKIADFFANIWANIKNGLVNAWSSIGEFFSGLGSKFFEWGVNILQGLWNGITSMANKVVEGVKNIGHKIAKGFKSIFGINSPSKLFAEYGMNITQGLAVGIDNGGSTVEGATEGMAAHTMNGMTQNMQSSTANTSNVMNGGNSGASLNYSPQITITGSASQETMAEFSKLLKQHANEIVSIIQRDADNTARLSFNG